MKFLKRLFLYLYLSLVPYFLNAQNVEYGVELDTNYMMIGDQQHLVLKARVDPGVRIVFPYLRDTVVNGVEIISGPVRDSVKEKDGRWLFEERYVITAFDTGIYVIPPLPIVIESQEYNNRVHTDPMGMAVNTFQVDPQKGNYDIVGPHEVPWTLVEILPYLLWFLLGIAIVLLGWLYWERRRKNKPLFAPKKEEVPPHLLAIRALDEINEHKMWQTGKEKEYYTCLTDVIRQYLAGELSIYAMEQTTTEILRALANCSEVDNGEREKIAEMLTTADFVKFAKFAPLQDENFHYLNTAYEFVRNIHQRIEVKLAEERKQKEEQKHQEEMKRADSQEREKDKAINVEN